MDTVALLTKLQAKEGKELELENFLKNVLHDVENESSISTWHALRFDPSTFYVLDTFPDDEKRETHLKGQLEKRLMEKSSELLAQPPSIEKVDIIAVKLPEVVQY